MEEKKDETTAFQNNSVIQSVLIMAVPTIISQMITVLYNYADTIFVGQLNDPKQVAAIALAFPLMILFDSLFVVTAIIWVQPIMDLVAVIVSLLILRRFFWQTYRFG